MLFLVLFQTFFYAQIIENDTITRTASIVYSVNGNKLSFNPETPQLNQIAGAPKAFYTYYWEFGDGNYSFETAPKHTYKEKGNYKIKLSVTNNYDDGKPPTTRPKEVAINEANFDASENENHNLITAYNGFRLQTNRDPVPEEEIQLALSYGNTKEYPACTCTIEDGRWLPKVAEELIKKRSHTLPEWEIRAAFPRGYRASIVRTALPSVVGVVFSPLCTVFSCFPDPPTSDMDYKDV